MTRRAFALPLVVALSLSACDDESSGPLQEREHAFVWAGHVAPGATVSVRNFSGDITVLPSADDTVRVSVKLEWRKGNPDRAVHFTGERAGADVLICAVWGDGLCTAEDYKANMKPGRSTDAKAEFMVMVPAGVKLSLTTFSGDVAAQASAPVRATTLNGDVRVATAVGPVYGETLNGSVDLRMSSLIGTDSVVAKTLNGEAFIYLPELTDAFVDLGVANGSVSSAFGQGLATSDSKRKIQFQLGAGSRVVHAYALNGEVALRRLDAAGRSY